MSLKDLYEQFKAQERYYIALSEYTGKERCVCIQSGFDKYYGPGKGPFKVHMAIKLADIMYLMVSGRLWTKDKWIRRLSERFKVDNIQFIENTDELLEITHEFEDTIRRISSN